MEIMVVLVLSVAGLIHHFREKKGLILGAVLAVIVITLGTIFLSKTNQGRFLEMVDLNSTYAENKWGGRALRLEKWKFTLEAIIGNSIIGSGSGDYWFEMEKVYRKNNFELGLKEKFNSHNQYLQTALTLGFPGLVLLISILVFMLLQARKTNNFVLMLAVLSISLSMISESILERQTGIFLSVLFANLFYAISEFVNPKAARENSNLFKN
jgi:O-antigen ligase